MTNINRTANTDEAYRKLLLHKKSVLLEALAGNYQRLREAARDPEASPAHLLQEESLMIRLNRVLYTRFQEVVKALERLDRGEYGFCNVCCGPIAPERLTERPWTEQCRLCSEAGILPPVRPFSDSKVANPTAENSSVPAA